MRGGIRLSDRDRILRRRFVDWRRVTGITSDISRRSVPPRGCSRGQHCLAYGARVGPLQREVLARQLNLTVIELQYLTPLRLGPVCDARRGRARHL